MSLSPVVEAAHGAPPVPGFSPDGEPLCQAPEADDLCVAARRRWPEVEAELRRRLSGPDRPVEAVELDGLTQGLRRSEPPRSADQDPLLEQGVLALCAAHLLGRRALLPLGESLALRGLRVQRTILVPEQPPRALPVLGRPEAGGAAIEVCRTARAGQAAQTLIALAAAGLRRPLVIVDHAPVAGRHPALVSFHHAGLSPSLRDVVVRAAAPHRACDAAADMAPLRAILDGRNPWHLHRVAEVPWHPAWSGPVLREPQLLPEGLRLAEEVLGRPPGADEAFALASYALGLARRLLLADAPPRAAEEAVADETVARAVVLRDALRRLCARPLLPGQDGEPALFLLGAAEGRLLVEAGHATAGAEADVELGRLLCPCPAPAAYARLRVLQFPRDPPRALRVCHGRVAAVGGAAAIDLGEPGDGDESGRRSRYFVDGGDLRVHIELVSATGLLRGAGQNPAGLSSR